MNDAAWLDAFNQIAVHVRQAVTPLLGTEEGRAELGWGAGGDRTVELDRVAEEVVLRELRVLAERGERFSVVSEEIGRVDLGAEFPVVFVDPIDGSLNAKRGVPMAGVMLSLLDGPMLTDVRVGVVHSLFGGERWHAVRGGGLYRQGERIIPFRPADGGISVLALESSPRNLGPAGPLIQQAWKLRLLGCVAISLATAACGSVDVFCSAMRARAFDATAGLLMVQEGGGVATDFQGHSLGDVRAGLESRTTLLCAASPAVHRRALEVLQGGS